ncbi:hypothetical protein BGY98DRAFT_1103033 [Russula aff. rugulosa BPL654]|nr:hypothetical protein BGY98DRAFT_1103033 [Russula aff. rugulosa BPL654]
MARILSNVRQMKQRIAILPGPPMEMARAISYMCVSEERKEHEPLGEATVDITDTLKSGDFDGASQFLSPDRCGLNTQDRLCLKEPSADSWRRLSQGITAQVKRGPPTQTSSTGEDMPLPPLPPDAAPTKEEFLPSILCPGGSSRTGVVGTPSPPTSNGTAGHHHMTPNDSDTNATLWIHDT